MAMASVVSFPEPGPDLADRTAPAFLVFADLDPDSAPPAVRSPAQAHEDASSPPSGGTEAAPGSRYRTPAPRHDAPHARHPVPSPSPTPGAATERTKTADSPAAPVNREIPVPDVAPATVAPANVSPANVSPVGMPERRADGMTGPGDGGALPPPHSATGPAGPNGDAAHGGPSPDRASRIDAYLIRIRDMIAKRLVYPPMARRLRLTGSVTVRFRIDDQGQPLADSILVTGGADQDILRDGATRTIRDIDDFPPPPEGAMTVEVPVRFTLDRTPP